MEAGSSPSSYAVSGTATSNFGDTPSGQSKRVLKPRSVSMAMD